MGRKKWIVSSCDKELAKALAEECGIDALVSLILCSRGMRDPFEIDEFLDAGQPFSDPFEFINMDKAVDRITAAIDKKERIAVFGDYDADGVTSTAILYDYLSNRGADVMYYVPEREEGYGMSISAVDKLKEKGVSLIVTVDNGISAVAEVEHAGSLGIDVVVTDHHLPGDVLPSAVAVVDPHRADCTSEFKGYSGSGVAFKLICALENTDGEYVDRKYASLASIGTIADIMPLTGENRVLVRCGLENMSKSCAGIEELIKSAGLDKRPLTSGTVSFGIGPRLNAAGRMGNCLKAVRLLLEEDADTACSIAEDICNLNSNRQKIEKEITEDAVSIIEESGIKHDRVIVVCGKGWNHGVIGIVASRVAELYGKPTVVLSDDNGIACGSARSFGKFSIYDAISSAAGLLVKFGGHEQAAGVTLLSENVDLFRKQINEYAKSKYDNMPFAELHIDCKLAPSAFSVDLVKSLEILAPFGNGNPVPVFGIFGAKIENIRPVGGGKHLRLDISRNSSSTSVMLFGVPEDRFGYNKGDVLDFAVNAEITEYNGRQQVTLTVQDYRMSGVDEDRLLSDIRLYEKVCRDEELSCSGEEQCALTRDDIASVFKALRKQGGYNGSAVDILHLVPEGISYIKLRLAIDVLEELGIISSDALGDNINIKVNNVAKTDLSRSEIFCRFLS